LQSQPFFGQIFGAWGDYCVPRFYDGGTTDGEETQATTLSLWTCIESVYAFTCGGLHFRAFQQREKWFRKPQWPSYAAWWVADDQIPTWREASDRLEHLHDHGPTPFAFDFKVMFGADNEPYVSRQGN